MDFWFVICAHNTSKETKTNKQAKKQTGRQNQKEINIKPAVEIRSKLSQGGLRKFPEVKSRA